jgi:peptidoglycan/xylan/chitin deacetylase (PgdA/CDA1 family)
MRIWGGGTLRRAAARIRRRFLDGSVILLYHRVAEIPSDPQLLCVAPRNFAEHLEIMRKWAHPMSLGELVRGYRNAALPRRAVAVTFDDGYSDNLYEAKPLLDRYDVPATAFVTTGALGSDREFWWDELDRCLLQPGILPRELRLTIHGRWRRWDLGEAAHYGQTDYQRDRAWNVCDRSFPGPRQRLYHSLHRMLKPLRESERRRVLDEVIAWAGVKATGRPTHRALSRDEVVRLIDGALIDVGAHTVTHTVLARLPVSLQEAEIRESRATLEAVVGRPVTGFAYPYGFRSDYTARTRRLVRTAGLQFACATFPDVVWRGSDRYQLPRVVALNWNGEEFAKRLERWLSR